MKLAHGIFGWCSSERVTNRYGSIHLMDKPYEGDARVEVNIDKQALNSLVGLKVRLTVKITESRVSSHIGDHALSIYPPKEAPLKDSIIDLGVGVLASEPGYDGVTTDIVLQPDHAACRKIFWMDPRKLYVLHDQTVEIHAEETTDPLSPAPDINDSERGAFDNGDGSMQFKRVPRDTPLRVMPRVQRLGGGMFALTSSPGFGQKLDIEED